jgi:putative SOS response-associated peptidase YedK
MCGRFSLFTAGSVISDRFNIDIDEPLKARYNIAPGQDAAVIMRDVPNRLSFLRWGLIPAWAKDEKFSMINIRTESLVKPAFKEAFAKRRCLIIADGFYEWKKLGDEKIPYRIILDKPFAFAGIYDIWKDKVGFAIVTTEPNSTVKPIHDRMPVILKEEYEKVWLSDIPTDILLKFLVPYPGKMKAYRISRLVNSPANDNPDLIEEFSDEQKTLQV